jgi:hypothetical protein
VGTLTNYNIAPIDQSSLQSMLVQGGHHHPPPLQVSVMPRKSLGVPLVGTLTISDIAPIDRLICTINVGAGRAPPSTAYTGYRYQNL